MKSPQPPPPGSGRTLRIPLAWLQLSYDKLRLLAAVSGIVFAVALMLIQLGFRDALYLAAIQIHNRLQADLVMVSTQYEYLVSARSFSQRHLYRTLAIEGVDAVVPIYLGLANWQNRFNKRQLPIFVMGFDPSNDALNLEGVNRNQNRLKIPDTVLFDAGSKPEYGPVKQELEAGRPVVTEVTGHQVDVAGTFTLGISFASDGNLITSDQSFRRIFRRPNGLIDLGLIRLRPRVNAEDVRARIAPLLPAGLKLMTREEYTSYEQQYWAIRTPIGFVFNLGALVGFVVGAVIVYQILYTDVIDHLGEYATLKAMGYSDTYLFGVVIRQALMLAIVGFIPGWLISTGMTVLTRKVTLLPSYMTWDRSLIVLVLTILMCVVSGMIAMRKLRTADPADIF